MYYYPHDSDKLKERIKRIKEKQLLTNQNLKHNEQTNKRGN